ncbi:MAG: sugar transferase [Fidelibacterota bacterium]
MLETLQHLRIRYPRWIIAWCLYFTDAIFTSIAFYTVLVPSLNKGAHFTQFELFLIFALGQVLLGIIFLPLNLYQSEPTVSRIYEIQQLVKVTFLITLVAIFIDALTPDVLPVKAQEILRYWLVLIMFLSIPRWIFRSVQKLLLTKGYGLRKTIIVGVNDRGFQVADNITLQKNQGFDLLGFVQSDDDPELDNLSDVNIIGHEKDLKSIILENQISEVIVAPIILEHTHVTRIITRANGSPVSIKIVPDLHEVISGLARTEQIYGLPLIKVNPNLETVYNTIIKRLLDLLIALPSLVISLPIWILTSAVIKIDSKGPIFYKQDRVGKLHKHFTIYKFRTMVENAEQLTGPVWASEEDTRITRVGRILRRFRLDELPQLLMVIKGDMSLIGPRPERPYFVDKLVQEYPFYYRRLKIRPGITGWAQIKHPYDQEIEDVRQKLKYDFYYIENLSFSLDLKILLSTAWVMLSGEGR